MRKGRIISSERELYCVQQEDEIYYCKARGVFREKGITPVVGDFVLFEISEGNRGLIVDVLERKNLLLRPPVANVDQVFYVQTLQDPDINRYLVDKYLCLMEHLHVEVKIIFNKMDRHAGPEWDQLIETYKKAGYQVFETSAHEKRGIEEVEKHLIDKVSTFAGPSGVGKSSLILAIHEDFHIQVGSVSDKTGRGRHTTRKISLYELPQGGYLFDTPGFSSLHLDFFESPQEIEKGFREFQAHSDCKFNNCLHRKEPGCGVKKALEEGEIAPSRYQSYLQMLEEFEKKRRY